ncbi:MAG: VaFE repeat-containing surface-anchored protein [Lachnospiraceae bacterium]|nr:VaFE repeat-containing surface-anchored protein [Lachnospiraceae bacterium]
MNKSRIVKRAAACVLACMMTIQSADCSVFASSITAGIEQISTVETEIPDSAGILGSEEAGVESILTKNNNLNGEESDERTDAGAGILPDTEAVSEAGKSPDTEAVSEAGKSPDAETDLEEEMVSESESSLPEEEGQDAEAAPEEEESLEPEADLPGEKAQDAEAEEVSSPEAEAPSDSESMLLTEDEISENASFSLTEGGTSAAEDANRIEAAASEIPPVQAAEQAVEKEEEDKGYDDSSYAGLIDGGDAGKEPAAESVSNSKLFKTEKRAALTKALNNSPVNGTENSPNFLSYLGLGGSGEAYYAFLEKYSSEDYDTGFFMGTPYTNTVHMSGSNITESGFDGAWFMASPRGNNRQGINSALPLKYRGGMNCTGFGTALFSQFGTEQGKNVDGLLPGRRQNGTCLPGFMNYDWNYFLPGNPGFGKVKIYQFGDVDSGSSAVYGNWEAVKAEMLSSGVLEYGDIIYSFPSAVGKYNVSGGQDNHWGVYLGDGKSDIYWHSAYGTGQLKNAKGEIVSLYDWNVKTEIYPKYANCGYVVIKVGAKHTNGYLQVFKEVAVEDHYLNNRLTGSLGKEILGHAPRYYMGPGITYTAYSDQACTKSVGTMKLNALYPDDSKEKLSAYSNVLAVPAGTYYVKETSVPTTEIGITLTKDSTVHKVIVTESSTSAKPVIVNSLDTAQFVFIQIRKVSSDQDYQMSLAGAEFLVYSDHKSDGSPDAILGTIKTRADGYSDTGNGSFFAVPARSDLYIKEISAPFGYEINDEEIHLVGGVDYKCGWSYRKSVTVEEEPSRTKLQIIKAADDAAKGIVTGNSNYSLAGAEFAVFKSGANIRLFTDNGRKNQLWKFVPLDGPLKTNAAGLPLEGDYKIVSALADSFVMTVYGASADSGANICLSKESNHNAQSFHLSGNGGSTVLLTCKNSGKVIDAERAMTSNGTNIRQYNSNGTDAQQWELIPSGDGYYKIKASYCGLVMDAEAFMQTTDAAGKTPVYSDLTVGDYYVVETRASSGFEIPAGDFTPANPHKVAITSSDLMTTKVVTCKEPIRNALVTVEITKEDAEGEAFASLAGAWFEIRYYKGSYSENELPDQPERIWTLETKESPDGSYKACLLADYLASGAQSDDFYYCNGSPTVPFGTIAVAETRAPAGYAYDEGKILKVVKIDEAFLSGKAQGDTAAVSVKVLVSEKRTRCGLSFTKIDYDGTKLAGVPFLIRSVKTGEEHVLLTDKNGILSTESNAHSQKTNINDLAYQNGKLDESKLDSTAGVWFSGKAGTDLSHPDDLRGALPFGEYVIEELRSSANAGMALADPIRVNIEDDAEDGKVIDLGVVVDVEKSITTKVSSVKSGMPVSFAENDAEFTDIVTLRGFKGDCVIKTSVYESASKEQLAFSDGKKEITTRVSADGSDLTVKVPFRLNALGLAGKTAAVVTEVSDGSETMTHNKDDSVSSERIYFPLIKTKASASSGQYASLSKETLLFDEVIWSGIPVGIELITKTRAYVLRESAAEDQEIKEAAVSSAYTNETVNGSRKVEIRLDTEKYAGKTIYITEEAYVTSGGRQILVAKENDRLEKDQYIYIPELKTTALNAESGSKTIPAFGNVSIRDKVRFSGFKTGENLSFVTEAWAKGESSDKDTLLASVNGSRITQSGSGSYDVALSVDMNGHAGKEVYVMEKVFVQDKLIASEGGRNNEQQTVKSVSIGTRLTDKKTKTKTALGETQVTLCDEIAYQGLMKGEKYSIFTLLMDEDGFAVRKDGQVSDIPAKEAVIPDESLDTKEKREAAIEKLLEENNLIYAKSVETAEASEGSFFAELTFDGVPLLGTKVVASESLYEYGCGNLLAIHSDPKDEKQTVHFPKLITEAKDYNSGTKMTAANRDALILDTVFYEAMPGDTKVITEAELFLKGAEAAGDQSLVRIRGEQQLSGNGVYTVEIPFDASAYAGRELYVTEKNYLITEDGAEKLIALHADRDDQNQTVRIPKIATTLTDDKTKGHASFAEEEVTLTDRIVYEGLEPGREYSDFIILMDKEGFAKMKDGTTSEYQAKELSICEDDKAETAEEKADAIEEKLKSLNILYARDHFTADESGETSISITYDGTLFMGEAMVAGETVYFEGEPAAWHFNPEDENQTIWHAGLVTTAEDGKDGSKLLRAEKNAFVRDRVFISGTVKGLTYYMNAELWAMGESSGEDELLASVSDSFTASGTEEEYIAEIFFDASLYEGRKLYVRETAEVIGPDGERRKAAEEEGRNNPDQMVSVPEIGTELTDAETKTHLAYAGKEVINIDRIHYSGLIEGRTYPVIGILMNEEGYPWKTDGSLYMDAKAEELFGGNESLIDGVSKKFPEEKIRAVEDKLGNLGIITSSAEFTAEAEEGYAEVSFSYNGELLMGKKVVAAETVYEEGEVLAAHIEPEDDKQTVYLPKLLTSASNGREGGKKIAPGADTVVKDTLFYEGYPENTEILTVLELFDAETDEAVVVNNAAVKAEKTFAADASGKVEIEVRFDSSAYAGRRLGLTEKNYLVVDGKRILIAQDSYKRNGEQIVEIASFDNPPGENGRSNPKTGDQTNSKLWIGLILFVFLYMGLLKIKSICLILMRRSQ